MATIRMNLNKPKPSFQSESIRRNPRSGWFGLILIENFVSDWLRFIRIDVSGLIEFSRIDFWPFFIKQPWWKYRVEIHSKPIRTIPIYSDICIRTNANHSEPIRKTFCISFNAKRSKTDPTKSELIRGYNPNESEQTETKFSIRINSNKSKVEMIRIDFDWKFGFGLIEIYSDWCLGINRIYSDWFVTVFHQTNLA